MKRFSRFLLWATVCAVFVAVTVSPAISADKIKMGFVFSMTGGAASYGVSQKEGAQLAVDQINAAAGSGMQVAPIFEDDASVPQQGTNVYNKLINGDKVAVIIGPTLSNTAKITNPIAQQIGVTVLGVSNTAGGITEIGDYIFRDSLTEAVVIPNTIRVAKEKLGIKKVVLFYGNDDAFTKSGADVFRKALQAEGIQILSEQTFAKGDRDFSPQLTQIKSQSPDAIICSALVEEASGIVSQARQLGIPKTVPHHRRQRLQLPGPDEERRRGGRRGHRGGGLEHLLDESSERQVRGRLHQEIQPPAGSVCRSGLRRRPYRLSGGQGGRHR